jgi:hypothetical protein
MYLLLILFLLARRSQQVLCLGLERGLKPLPNELLVIIININLITIYQLLLNCNKVHRALPVSVRICKVFLLPFTVVSPIIFVVGIPILCDYVLKLQV